MTYFQSTIINHRSWPSGKSERILLTERFLSNSIIISSACGSILLPRARQMSPVTPTAAWQTCTTYEMKWREWIHSKRISLNWPLLVKQRKYVKRIQSLRENNVLLNFMNHYTASDIGYKRQGRSDGTSYYDPFSSYALRFNFPFLHFLKQP